MSDRLCQQRTPGQRLWIKQPLSCFTGDGSDARGGLVIEGEVIREVLATGEEPAVPCDQIFDAREYVILPGLINTHHHFYQTLTRAWGLVVSEPLFPWLQQLYPVRARLTPEALALATELLLSGCTTTSDHHYLFPRGMENAIDIEVDVVNQLGMRAVLTRGSMSPGQASGGLEREALIARHRQAARKLMSA